MNLPKSDMDQGRYYPNGYAAMNELNALQAGRWFPQDVTGTGEAHWYNDRIKGVADGLTIYSNVNENGLTINSLEELPKIVSDYIFARIFFINEEDQINSDIIRAYKAVYVCSNYLHISFLFIYLFVLTKSDTL